MKTELKTNIIYEIYCILQFQIQTQINQMWLTGCNDHALSRDQARPSISVVRWVQEEEGQLGLAEGV
jgi:hypothetical protein